MTVQSDTRFDGLDLEGRSPATVEFLALRARHAELVRAVRAVEQARDDAGHEASRLSDELAALERQRGGGENVAGKVSKAEAALVKARAASAEPWSERVRGAESAATDAAGAVQRFATANYAALMGELDEDAAAAAERCNAVLEAVQDAHYERERVSGRVAALAALAGLNRPNLVPESKLTRLARDAEAVLMAGGEVAPVARREPTTEAVA